MAATGGTKGHGEGRVYLAFTGLALLGGPVAGYASGAIVAAAQLQVFVGLALAELVAGVVLVGYAVARRQRLPGAGEWGALLLLLVPQLCAVPLISPVRLPLWLHAIGWGTALLLSLALPLWLGLVGAFDLAKIEVPRAVLGAAIAGMGAICLAVPTNAFDVGWNQVPMLLLVSLLGMATVVSWANARPRLEGLSTEWAAGGYLLLSCLGDALYAFVCGRSSWGRLEGHALVVPVLCDAATLAATWWLWFWLLQRMTLAAFAMRPLAMWAATIAPGLVLFGFLNWRIDAALAIAVVATVVALRARVAEEQPVVLGLGAP